MAQVTRVKQNNPILRRKINNEVYIWKASKALG